MLAQLNILVFITDVNYTRECEIQSSRGGNCEGNLWYVTPCNLMAKVRGKLLPPYSEFKVETVLFLDVSVLIYHTTLPYNAEYGVLSVFAADKACCNIQPSPHLAPYQIFLYTSCFKNYIGQTGRNITLYVSLLSVWYLK
jgi:hypothetical protein